MELMTDTWTIRNAGVLMETRWSPMMVASIFFHLAIFSIILFVPESFPSRNIGGIVYEVNLVEMPGGGDLKLHDAGTVKRGKGEAIVKKDTQAKRIQTMKKEEKPLVIAKRTIEKQGSPIKEPKISSSQLIERAISRIENKVKSEGSDHIDRAISRLESKVSSRFGTGLSGGQARGGIPIRLYQMEVESWIKSNWSYPVAVQSTKKLEATVLLKVKMDGTILKTWFKKRSSNSIFDQSVIKAIEKSDPLPPFPEGYRKSYEDFEISFNLKDLEG